MRVWRARHATDGQTRARQMGAVCQLVYENLVSALMQYIAPCCIWLGLSLLLILRGGPTLGVCAMLSWVRQLLLSAVGCCLALSLSLPPPRSRVLQ